MMVEKSAKKHVDMAKIYMKQGNFSMVKMECKRALEIDPENKDAEEMLSAASGASTRFFVFKIIAIVIVFAIAGGIGLFFYLKNKREKDYAAAMDKGKIAFQAKKWKDAIEQASIAMELMAEDKSAPKLKDDATNELDYENLCNEAEEFIRSSEFEKGLDSATRAGDKKSDDSRATGLKVLAQRWIQTVAGWKNPHESASYTPHKGAINAIAFSFDGGTMATAGSDNIVKLWQTADRKEIGDLREHAQYVMDVAFGAESNIVVSAGADGVGKFWNSAAKKSEADMKAHTGGVTACACSPDGRYIATGGTDQMVKVWGIPPPDRRKTGDKPEVLQTFTEHRGMIKTLAFSPDSTLLASAGSDNKIVIWNMKGGTQLTKMEAHKGAVNSICFSANGRYLASASNDSTVRVWMLTNLGFKDFKTFEINSGHLNSLSFCGDNSLIACGGQDGSVRVFSLKTGAEYSKFTVGSEITALKFENSAAFMAIGTKEGVLKVYFPTK